MTLNRSSGDREVPGDLKELPARRSGPPVGKVASGLAQGSPVGAEQGLALFVGLHRQAGEMPAGKLLRQANGDADLARGGGELRAVAARSGGTVRLSRGGRDLMGQGITGCGAALVGGGRDQDDQVRAGEVGGRGAGLARQGAARAARGHPVTLRAPGRRHRYWGRRAGDRPRPRVVRGWRSGSGSGWPRSRAEAVAQEVFQEGGLALGDALGFALGVACRSPFLPLASEFPVLLAQDALAHGGEALDFRVGAELAESIQGLLHRGVVDRWHAVFLLPVFEKGGPGGQGRCAGVSARCA